MSRACGTAARIVVIASSISADLAAIDDHLGAVCGERLGDGAAYSF